MDLREVDPPQGADQADDRYKNPYSDLEGTAQSDNDFSSMNPDPKLISPRNPH